MSQQTLIRPAVKQSRKVRVIHGSTFGTFEREKCWTWSVEVTWWHQKFGVVDFHRHVMIGEWPKATHPEAPTAETLLAEKQENDRHSWELEV